jgi:hypothetical protein
MTAAQKGEPYTPSHPKEPAKTILGVCIGESPVVIAAINHPDAEPPAL